MISTFRSAIAAGLFGLYAVLTSADPSAAQQPVQGQPKFCGDPTLVGDEPCLPPNWCEGPNGTYPARHDGSCHLEDSENGPPHSQAQAMRPLIPQFRCPEGYVPVLVGGNQPACAGDIQPPQPL
jgi:hypothetical protein